MGAWGMGIFDDDTSCDLIDEAMESDAKSFVEKVVNHKGSDYLEYYECQEVLVSGAILDAILNATKYGDDVEGFDDWISTQNSEFIATVKNDILSGLKIVISDKSELNELWQENKEDYPVWKANIDELIIRLSS